MRNRNSIYALAIIGVLVLSSAAMGLRGHSTGADVSSSKDLEFVDQQMFEPVLIGTTGPGDVAIELTPQATEGGQLIVQLSANTHSVDLSQFDLKQITTLEYNGQSVAPIEAPSLGGHHVYGNMVFNIEGEISKFTITIRDIPMTKERVFEWR